MLREFDSIFQILEAHSGITIANVHREYMEKLILERTAGMGISSSEYSELVRKDDAELSYLTNAATVNETYFFREEKQFDFLKNEIFIPNKNSKINIWSVSCSTGEEPISIYTLAKDCGLNFSIYASDIDTDALAKFKAGIYTKNSFRTDGSKYRSLIEDAGRWDGEKMTISQDLISQIRIFPYNLVAQDPPPVPNGSMDIIFMRNVFIYFSQEVRLKILNKLSKNLKEGGIVILSINEVGNINRAEIPFEKLHTGTVYYLKKISAGAGKEEKKKTSLPAHDKEPISTKPASFTRYVQQVQKAPVIPQSTITQAAEPAASAPAATAAAASTTAASNNDSIQEFYTKLDSLIEKDAHEEAWKILSERVFLPHEMEFKYFFQALIYAAKGDGGSAKGHLEKAVMLNRSFWPASFRLAVMQYKDKEFEKCKRIFEDCRSFISKYREDKRKDYDFLTGQFCPEYFEMLCDGYLKHIREG